MPKKISPVRIFFPLLMKWKMAGAICIVIALFSGMSYGFTCAGGASIRQGCPMGGIGGGNFNFQPDGTYNFTWIRVSADAGAAPLCIAFQKRGPSTFSGNLQNAGSVTTTYTGYWPTVNLKYAATAMLDSVQLKCFSPIIAGDGIASGNKNSSLPIAIYKFTIKNIGTASDTAAIALSNGANSTIVRNGTAVVGIKSATVCVMVDTAKSNPADSITCGSTASDFTADGLLDNAAAGILAKRIVVGPGETRTITFCVSWTNVNNGYYRNFFTDAQALATYGRDSAAILETKVDNWHNKVLNSNLPGWLKDLAINCMHPFNSMTDWVTPNTYGMQESMSSGMYGTNDQAYHAHFGLVCFAPDAAWSQVTRMAASQQSSGLFMHLYGGLDGIRIDVGQKFVMETLKDYQWTGQTDKLKGLYSNIKNTITGLRGVDSNGDGLSDDGTDITTYDNPGWDGWTPAPRSYENELFLSSIKGAIKAAVANGTPADTTDYHNYFNQGSATFEKAAGSGGFWNTSVTSAGGRTGFYQACMNSSLGHATAVWNSQFMGQWMSDVCGTGPLHPESRIESGLLVAYDACLDKSNPPGYDLMMANADVNCTANPPTGTFYNPGYVDYGSYGAGEFCAAFGHNEPDIAMRALHAYWNVNYSKTTRPYNAACKLNLNGDGTDWGAERYMNPPVCFAGLVGITGFSIDINARELRLKPSLPTSNQYKMDSLSAAPIFTALSMGTVDYKVNAGGSNPCQQFVVKFDNPMQFNTFYTKKMYASKVVVTKPAVNGSVVAATISVNPGDTSEYMITFGSTLTIDNTGVEILVGTATTGIRAAGEPMLNTVNFAFDAKRGTVSYVLPRAARVSLSLLDVSGVCVLRHDAWEGIGTHTVQLGWKNLSTGIYYVHFSAGDVAGLKKIVHVR